MGVQCVCQCWEMSVSSGVNKCWYVRYDCVSTVMCVCTQQCMTVSLCQYGGCQCYWVAECVRVYVSLGSSMCWDVSTSVCQCWGVSVTDLQYVLGCECHCVNVHVTG